MKKLISTTILLLSIGLSLLSITAIASATDFVVPEVETQVEHVGQEEPTTTTTTTTTMPSIPKPDYLPGPDEGSSQQGITDYFINEAIPGFISGFIGFVGIMAFLALVIGGIQFMTAYGNDEKLGSAKKTVTYAIVGFVIAIFAYAIVSIVSSVNLETVGPGTSFIPTAYAIDINELLPSEEALIENSPNAQGASLPGGDFGDNVIPSAIRLILYAASTVVMVSLVYSGIQLVIAQGNEEQIKKAYTNILYTIVGIITIAISYAIIYGIAKIKF